MYVASSWYNESCIYHMTSGDLMYSGKKLYGSVVVRNLHKGWEIQILTFLCLVYVHSIADVYHIPPIPIRQGVWIRRLQPQWSIKSC